MHEQSADYPYFSPVENSFLGVGYQLICSILRGQMPYATLWRMQTIHLRPKFVPMLFSTERLGEENVRNFYWNANQFYSWKKLNQFQ